MDRARQWANSVRLIVDARLKQILLFGGTFDPVHNGHAAMVAAAMAETGSSRLILLPAGNPYQRGRLPFASALHRTAMLKIAFAETADVSIDTRELARTGPTFTVDTLRELRQVLGDNVALTWLIGCDAFARLDSWHEWQTLFTFANFAVAIRQGEPHPMQAASAELKLYLANRQVRSLGESTSGHYAMLAGIIPSVSSTAIRARLKNHQSIRGLAPDGVCDYIEHHKLYEQEENT